MHNVNDFFVTILHCVVDDGHGLFMKKNLHIQTQKELHLTDDVKWTRQKFSS